MLARCEPDYFVRRYIERTYKVSRLTSLRWLQIARSQWRREYEAISVEEGSLRHAIKVRREIQAEAWKAGDLRIVLLAAESEAKLLGLHGGDVEREVEQRTQDFVKGIMVATADFFAGDPDGKRRYIEAVRRAVTRGTATAMIEDGAFRGNGTQ